MTLTEELYSRQSSLDLSIPSEAVIVGCGGVGTWLGVVLVLGGTEKLLVIDHDTVASHNLNRLPYPASSVGAYKAEALRNFLRTLRGNTSIVALPRRFNEASLLLEAWSYRVVYCCTDTLASQGEVYDYCQSHGREYRRVGYDGFHITLSQKGPPKWGEQEDGYRVVPAWAGGAMAAAALATVAAVWREVGAGRDVGVDLQQGWLGGADG